MQVKRKLREKVDKMNDETEKKKENWDYMRPLFSTTKKKTLKRECKTIEI